MGVIFGLRCSLIVADFDLGWSFMMLVLLIMVVCKNDNGSGLEWVSSSLNQPHHQNPNLPCLVTRFLFFIYYFFLFF